MPQKDVSMTNANLLRGHPVSLHVLDYGLFKVHANGRVIGICGFLIRTSEDENVLIDTGFPAKYAQDATAATAEDNLGSFGEVLECGPDNLPAAQLARAGVTPDQITLMIQTHTHIDHVGGLHDFPGVPILMSEAERDLEKPLYWGDVRPIDWPDSPYHLIGDDTRIGPGFQVLHVPGHAPGQLAMLVDLPDTGTVLLTSDAISRAEEIDEKFAGSWNESLARYHGARLMELAVDRGAMIIFGHSPEQWPTLKKAPEAYT
jgi:N-acyl homoserine lactone hydrolase